MLEKYILLSLRIETARESRLFRTMKIFGKAHEILRFSVLAMLFLTIPVKNSPAQERRAGSANVSIKPIYNPETKSYFELRVDLPKPPNWNTAARYARTKVFKGVRGRLAVVKDLQTHSFLQANFEIREEAWIGLRYFCSFRKLVWADGTEQPRTALKMWSKKWYRTDVRCGKQNIQYMPIYYLPNAKGFRWQASGPAKYFVSYFVEYPTGGREPQNAPAPEDQPDNAAAPDADQAKPAEPEASPATTGEKPDDGEKPATE